MDRNQSVLINLRHQKKPACLLALAAALLAGCATKAERAAQQAEQVRLVATALQQRRYSIDIQQMTPRRGGLRPVSYGFSLAVKGDTLVSYLPYFGRVYSVPYAGSGKGLNFTGRIREYTDEQPKPGVRRVRLKVANEEDAYLFAINVYDSGQATIDLQARERESVSYSGEVRQLP